MFSHKSFSRQSFAPESWGPFTIVLPPVVTGGGGGGGAAGVAGYKLPKSSDFEHEERIRAEIIREDEEILAVLMGAVTSGALQWVH